MTREVTAINRAERRILLTIDFEARGYTRIRAHARLYARPRYALSSEERAFCFR